MYMVLGQNETTRGAQVLVHVSIDQRLPMFDPLGKWHIDKLGGQPS